MHGIKKKNKSISGHYEFSFKHQQEWSCVVVQPQHFIAFFNDLFSLASSHLWPVSLWVLFVPERPLLHTQRVELINPKDMITLNFFFFVWFYKHTNTGWVIILRKLWHFTETENLNMKFLNNLVILLHVYIYIYTRQGMKHNVLEQRWTLLNRPSVKTWELCCWVSSGTGPERLTHIHTQASDITSWWLNHWTHRCVLLYVCLSTSVCVF